MTYKKCNIMREDEDKTCKTVVTLGSDIDDVEIHIIRDAMTKKRYKLTISKKTSSSESVTI